MSRKGNCYDNTPQESFWGTLNNKLIHHKKFATRQEAIRDIREYFEMFFSLQRKLAKLGYFFPALFEM